MLRHGSGSAILRKSPPVQGGSGITRQVCEGGSAAKSCSIESENMQEAHVHYIYRTFQRIAAVAVIGAVVITGTAQFAQAQAAPEKKVKDQGEYDIFNQTIKDASNPAQQIKDLDTWTQKYPDSDYKDDRLYYYIQANNATNQPANGLAIGSQLRGRTSNQDFHDPHNGPHKPLPASCLAAV